MNYVHTKIDHFYQGLPVGDLADDADLTDEQFALLDAGISQGVYTVRKSVIAGSKSNVQPAKDSSPKTESDKKTDEYQSKGNPDNG